MIQGQFMPCNQETETEPILERPGPTWDAELIKSHNLEYTE